MCTGYISPMDIEFGPNGSIYVVEWGQGFNENNPDSGVYRIDYIQGERQPIANASADNDAVPVGATVNFSLRRLQRPGRHRHHVPWDFKDGTPTSTAANPSHTFTAAGTYDVTLTVTDASGDSCVDTIRVVVGNQRPVVTIVTPENGKVADFGDKVEYEVTVTDPDGGPGGTPLEISEGDPECADIRIEVKLGHDTHAHELASETGCSGDFTVTGADGHGIDANVFTVITANYTDDGNGPAVGVTGSDEAILHTKLKQAEFWSTTGRLPTSTATGDPGIVNETTTDVGGGSAAAFIEDGDWISFNPYNLEDLDTVTFRVASAGAGGTIELHFDDPTSPAFLTTPVIAPTGGWQTWKDVTVDLPDTVPDGHAPPVHRVPQPERDRFADEPELVQVHRQGRRGHRAAAGHRDRRAHHGRGAAGRRLRRDGDRRRGRGHDLRLGLRRPRQRRHLDASRTRPSPTRRRATTRRR